MKRFQTMCLAVAAAIAGAASVGRAAVFDEVPSDALAVFAIHSVDQLNTKLGKFNDSTGMTQLGPGAKDPVTFLENQLGMTQGINNAGEMAVAVFHSGDAQPTRLLLLPVNDYKAFVGNFPNPQEDADGITATQMKDGSDIFIAHWGDYAALGETKDLLAHKPAGIKLDGAAADALKINDAIVYFNIDQARTVELPRLDKDHDEIIAQIGQRHPELSPILVKIMGNLALNQAKEFLKDAKSTVTTINVTDDGIALRTIADFQPDTPFSQLAAAMKSGDAPTLTGLPDKHYVAVVGATFSAELKQQITALIVDPLTKQLEADDANDKPLSDMLAAGKAKLAATDSTCLGLVTPDGTPGQDSMVELIGEITGDAPAWKKGCVSGLSALSDASKSADPAAPVNVTIDIKPDATTVGDVHLDQFTIKTDFTGTGRRAMRAKRMQTMIFGPNSQDWYLGTATDKVGLVTLGIDDQGPLMADTIAAAKSGKDVLSAAKSVSDVSAKLPTPRVAEGYVFLDQLVDTGIHAAQSMGLGIRIALPADVAPIGFALSGSGSTIQGDGFIPQSLVKSLVGAAVDLQNGMGGGGGGGGGDNGGKNPLPGGQGL
jgi:hypothetical protein